MTQTDWTSRYDAYHALALSQHWKAAIHYIVSATSWVSLTLRISVAILGTDATNLVTVYTLPLSVLGDLSGSLPPFNANNSDPGASSIERGLPQVIAIYFSNANHLRITAQSTGELTTLSIRRR